MQVTELRLEQFRNQDKKTVKLSPKTLVTGVNGAGKTSVLEAIRLISVGKSFRTSRLEDLVMFDRPYLRLILRGQEKEYEYFYGNQFADSPLPERRLSVDGKAVSYMNFLGELPSVSFSPKDVDIITEQPSLRRQFVDGILWQAHPEFRHNQLEYSRVLRERAQLLFLLKINRAGLEELRPWDELLVGLADKIRAARRSFVDFANQQTSQLKDSIPGKISIELKIETSPDSLSQLQQQEIRLGHNLYGPHRDDIVILCNDRLARRFASRGQARSAIALLKAIEATYLEEQIRTTPIVLLDDVVSELDADNIAWLFSIYGAKYQMIATSVAKTSSFKDWSEVKV